MELKNANIEQTIGPNENVLQAVDNMHFANTIQMYRRMLNSYCSRSYKKENIKQPLADFLKILQDDYNVEEFMKNRECFIDVLDFYGDLWKKELQKYPDDTKKKVGQWSLWDPMYSPSDIRNLFPDNFIGSTCKDL